MTVELRPLIVGAKIISVFTQEKDKLIFTIESEGKEKFIEISVNPGFPYIILKQDYSRAKKNTYEVFRSFLNSKITGIFIADNDRIITINTSSGNIFFRYQRKVYKCVCD